MVLSLILTMQVVQQESESEYVFPNNCYSQFTEDEMYSIQLQMTELGEPEHRMHKCPHAQMSTSSIKRSSNFKLFFLEVLYCT